MAYIQGWIAAVIYRAEDYHILAFTVEDSEPPSHASSVKVAAYLFGMPQVRPGVPLKLVGEWRKHPKYGHQLVSYEWHPWAKTPGDAEKFLQDCIEGFADRDLVKLVVSAFGTDTFEVLTNDPDKVLCLGKGNPTLSAALHKAVAGWAQAQMTGRLAPLLRDGGIPPKVLKTILARFGLDAVQVTQENPYRLVSVEGFSLAFADRLAAKLGIERTDPRRVEGAILEALYAETQNGHLFVHLADLGPVIRNRLDAETLETLGDLGPKIKVAVEALAARKDVIVDGGIYLPGVYHFEQDSARKLVQYLEPAKIDVDITAFLAEYERSQQITLSEAQRGAVFKLIENKVLVLTGLPGTGKTLITKAFTALFRQAGLSFRLMAPTGIAAKRLALVTSSDAATVHRTFRFDRVAWLYGRDRKFAVDAVIVDESSMLDQELFYRILDALHPGTMLVFVGDDAQLPSVGAGNVLRELVSCSAIPHVRLTQIFRQAETSEIVHASHRINRGESPLTVAQKEDSEFRFIPVDGEDRLAKLIVDMSAKLKGRDENFQVLSPKYGGIVGVDNLNECLRERLNPNEGQAEWRSGNLRLRVGDRLMVVQNDYERSIYNGDTAKLIGISPLDLEIRVHGISKASIETVVRVPKNIAADMLRLAYAVTVHRCQGNEFSTVIIPIVRNQGIMLQRNLLYTAITRARKKVWLLGDPRAVQQAIDNDNVLTRNSVLGSRILRAVEVRGGVISGEVETQLAAFLGAQE
jgi:exodeoxyribonuclease V alpha subunit